MSFFIKKFKPKLEGKIGFLNLEEWYLSLPSPQQQKVKDYSGEGDELTTRQLKNTSQTQKHFLGTVASNAYYKRDYKFALSTALEGLKLDGSLVDEHFLYNTIIETYERLFDEENIIKYCNMEINKFNKIGAALRESFHGRLPPSIPARDFLLKIAMDKEDYDAAIRLINIFKENTLFEPDEADNKIIGLKLKVLYSEADKLLEQSEIENAKTIFDEILNICENEKSNVNKMLGNYFFDVGKDLEAYYCYKTAIQNNPEIKGIKTKITKIAKKNKLPLDFM